MIRPKKIIFLTQNSQFHDINNTSWLGSNVKQFRKAIPEYFKPFLESINFFKFLGFLIKYKQPYIIVSQKYYPNKLSFPTIYY